MARPSGPFIVVYGDEDFYLDRFVEKRRAAWKDRHVRVRDGGTLKEIELVNMCEAQTMFDDGGRAIILENAQDLKADKSKALETFIEERDPKDSSLILLAVVRAKKLPAIWTEASKKGAQASYLKFKPWESHKVIDRITEEAKLLHLKLEPGVAELIFKALGDDLRTTVNELRKIAYLVGEDAVVKSEHVLKVIAKNMPAEAYQVGDAAIAKNVKQAMTTMSLVYKMLGEGACVPVTAGLIRQVEKTLIVRQMMDKGDHAKVIGARLNIPEFVVMKNLVPIAHKHSVKSLVGHMKNLCKLDAQVKGAARSKRTLVELAILSIAA